MRNVAISSDAENQLHGASAPGRLALVDKFHNERTAWVVLAVSLLITLFSWWLVGDHAEERARDRFNFETQKAAQSIAKRMQEYEQVLRGGVGLFLASRDVTRKDWQAYVSNLQIDTYWPGIQGIGFARILKPEELQPHIDAVRNEGFFDFTVTPEGTRETYSSIVFLEPFNQRNQRAFGYDMYSNETRRAAMNEARDTGKPAVSALVTLVQENGEDMQVGFLMYLPLYKKGMPVTTVEERRAAIHGFVYSPFRAKDLMTGILGTDSPYLDFSIYDGKQVDKKVRLYESIDPHQHASKTASHLIAQKEIQLPGRIWTARFQSNERLERELRSAQPMIIGIGGIAVDILLFSIIWSLSQSRKESNRQAQKMAVMVEQLRQASECLERMAKMDGLTDIPNRRALEEILQRECSRASRNGKPLSVLMIDIDFFKAFNDHYGHLEGDACLRKVAQTLRANQLRASDFVARYGGEEFAAVLPECDPKAAHVVAEKLRAAIVSLAIPHAYSDVADHVTISIGCTTRYKIGEGECANILSEADAALYEAKKAGRNQVKIWA